MSSKENPQNIADLLDLKNPGVLAQNEAQELVKIAARDYLEGKVSLGEYNDFLKETLPLVKPNFEAMSSAFGRKNK